MEYEQGFIIFHFTNEKLKKSLIIMSTSSHMRDIIKNIMAFPEKYYKLTKFSVDISRNMTFCSMFFNLV